MTGSNERESLNTSREPLRVRVACDTPVGVEFADLNVTGNGVLVAERFVEAFAKARGHRPDECELLMIDDRDTGRQMWPN